MLHGIDIYALWYNAKKSFTTACAQIKMARMCVQRNGLACIETKKSDLNANFLHKYLICPTTMHLGSLEPVYDIR
jgi:hypothetical protein